jgi:hypothetical protein
MEGSLKKVANNRQYPYLCTKNLKKVNEYEEDQSIIAVRRYCVGDGSL